MIYIELISSGCTANTIKFVDPKKLILGMVILGSFSLMGQVKVDKEFSSRLQVTKAEKDSFELTYVSVKNNDGAIGVLNRMVDKEKNVVCYTFSLNEKTVKIDENNSEVQYEDVVKCLKLD